LQQTDGLFFFFSLTTLLEASGQALPFPNARILSSTGLLPNISGAAKLPLAPVKAQVFKKYYFSMYFVKYF